MIENYRNNIGKVFISEVFVGTGFLISENIFVTARHCIISTVDITKGDFSDKEVKIVFYDKKAVIGKTLDINFFHINSLDFSIILLENPVEREVHFKLCRPKNRILDFDYKTFGYIIDNNEGLLIKGKIQEDEYKDIEYDLILGVEKNYINTRYDGLSGAPFIVNGFVLGMIVKADNKKLYGISWKYISEKLKEDYKKYFVIHDIDLKKFSLVNWGIIENKLNRDFFKNHIEEAFQVAGPRYKKEFTLDNKTHQKLFSFVNENRTHVISFLNYIEKFKKNLNSIFDTSLNKNFTIYSLELYHTLDENYVFKLINFSIEELKANNNVVYEIDDIIRTLEHIIYEEKEEEKNNKIPYAVNEINFLEYEVEKLKEWKDYFETLDISFLTEKFLLLKGEGGIGKTHALCDLSNQRIKENKLSLLFFGQYFGVHSPETIIIEKLGLHEFNFDDLLYFLDTIGFLNDQNILISIDALDELKDSLYWNSNLKVFLEKLKPYPRIKLICSCRITYVQNILSHEILRKFIQLEHEGIDINEKNKKDFFEHYGIEYSFDFKFKEGFTNPLFLRYYCEFFKYSEYNEYNFDFFSGLIKSIFEEKEKIISLKYEDFSYKDKIISEFIDKVVKEMYSEGQNFLPWKQTKFMLIEILDLYRISYLSNKILIDIIGENLLKENNYYNFTISFAYERFFDYLLADYLITLRQDLIIGFIESQFHFQGVVPIIFNLYKFKFNEELIYFTSKSERIYKLFIESLATRNFGLIDDETKILLEEIMFDIENSDLRKKVIFLLLKLSMHKDCMLNAEYLNTILIKLKPFERMKLLALPLLDYDANYTMDIIFNEFLEEDNLSIAEEYCYYLALTLTWLTSVNNLIIRDRASKSLTKLFLSYPNLIEAILENFKTVDDDYIQERLWGAVYASILLSKNERTVKFISNYVYLNYIQANKFPLNVLIRDILRNIGEFANKLNILDYSVDHFRPPYKSEKLEKIFVDYDKMPKHFRNLHYNCTMSDFAIYTIGRDISNYGFTHEEVGYLIYNEIIALGYDELISNIDKEIDKRFDSSRGRKSGYERIGKKYQKIFLYRIMGQILDNEEYKGFYSSFAPDPIIPNEQGIKFRRIDLTSLPYVNLKIPFKGHEFKYDFKSVKRLSYLEWLSKKDLEELSKEYLKFIDNDEKEYLLLNTHFSDKSKEENDDEYPFLDIWISVRSYIIKKSDIEIFKVWSKDKHFWGMNMLEEERKFYEGWIGEYPWSPFFYNTFNQLEKINEFEEETDDIQDDNMAKILEVITNSNKKFDKKLQETDTFTNNEINFNFFITAHEYISERESQFCNSKISDKFMFPASEFFEDLDLTWNGQNVYFYNDEPMFIIPDNKDAGLYVNKNLLIDYLNKNDLCLVWNILGEKRKIKGMEDNTWEGSCEFSESYILEDDEIVHNHFFENLELPGSRIKTEIPVQTLPLPSHIIDDI